MKGGAFTLTAFACAILATILTDPSFSQRHPIIAYPMALAALLVLFHPKEHS